MTKRSYSWFDFIRLWWRGYQRTHMTSSQFVAHCYKEAGIDL